MTKVFFVWNINAQFFAMSCLAVYHNQCTKTVKISPVIGVIQTNEMDLKERVLLSIPTYFRQNLAR